MAVRHVQDVQLTLVHAIQSLVQETANGLLGMHGANALQRAMVELRTEQEMFYRKHPMEEKTARVQHQSSEIATWQNAQLTVNGAHGVHGTYVQEPVVVECRDEVGEFYNTRGMEAGPVKGMHRKCKDVIWKHVQFVRTAQDMHDSVQHGSTIALTANSSKDVAKNHVDCVKKMTHMY